MAGFTTDPRMLEALIELVQEQNPARHTASGNAARWAGDTLARDGSVWNRGSGGADRRGALPFRQCGRSDMYTIDRPISFNEISCSPRPVRGSGLYILALPKWKVPSPQHPRSLGPLKLQFGNLPDYDWMVRWPSAELDIYQKDREPPRAPAESQMVRHGLAIRMPRVMGRSVRSVTT